MKTEEKMELLQSTLIEMKNAYYGGFRATQEVEQLESFKWAIEKLESIRKVYPELFVD